MNSIPANYFLGSLPVLRTFYSSNRRGRRLTLTGLRSELTFSRVSAPPSTVGGVLVPVSPSPTRGTGVTPASVLDCASTQAFPLPTRGTGTTATTPDSLNASLGRGTAGSALSSQGFNQDGRGSPPIVLIYRHAPLSVHWLVISGSRSLTAR